MNKKKINEAFSHLNDHLKKRGIKGEIGVVGGAAMVLAFNAREATKDVDAIFKPGKELRDAAKKVAHELDLPVDWLNDAVKGYMSPNLTDKKIVAEFDSLLVWVPPAEYLLAMKAISARFDSKDADDFKLLAKHLKLKAPGAIFKIIERYYPSKQIPAKTRFFVEELFNK